MFTRERTRRLRGGEKLMMHTSGNNEFCDLAQNRVLALFAHAGISAPDFAVVIVVFEVTP